MINRNNRLLAFIFLTGLALFNASAALAQSTAFTYQGKLTDNGNPATGIYDLNFGLFDSPAVGSGTQQGTTLNLTGVVVTNGAFAVQLDFGACESCFNGAARYLEIGIRPAGGSTFTTLAPRQALTASPYAIKSLSAAMADDLSVTCVSCVTSSQIASVNGSAVSGAIPVASVPAGSGNYIQNATTQQASSNFNISGSGTAGGTLSGNILNATTQYNISGNRFLSNPGTNNVYVGVDAGINNIGARNTYVGQGSGFSIGSNNTFVGSLAGANFSSGSNNTTLGVLANIREFGTSINNATAIGYRAEVSQSDSLVLGDVVTNVKVGIGITAPAFKLHIVDPSNTGLRVQTELGGGTVASFGGFGAFQIDAPGVVGGRFVVKENGFVGIGTAAPGAKLEVNGNVLVTNGFVGIGTPTPRTTLEVGGGLIFVPSTGGTTSICRTSINQLAACSSSLRYKTNVVSLDAGLSLVNRLRPVTFDWKQNKEHDLGLVAEEVAQVEPLLVIHSDKGEIEGVKYDRLNVVLINAIKEQQSQIETLKKENHEMKARLTALERLMLEPRHHQVENVNKTN